jgi:hypothetical protein
MHKLELAIVCLAILQDRKPFYFCSRESLQVCDLRSRLRLKCDGTCAETIFRPSAKRTSPFKSAGSSVQSTTGSRGVRISGSNAGYTMFRGSVKSTPFASFPFTSPPLRHRVPSHFNWSLPTASFSDLRNSGRTGKRNHCISFTNEHV